MQLNCIAVTLVGVIRVCGDRQSRSNFLDTVSHCNATVASVIPNSPSSVKFWMLLSASERYNKDTSMRPADRKINKRRGGVKPCQPAPQQAEKIARYSKWVQKCVSKCFVNMKAYRIIRRLSPSDRDSLIKSASVHAHFTLTLDLIFSF